MIGNAFIIGFFTALGWISAHKIVATVDTSVTPVVKIQEEK